LPFSVNDFLAAAFPVCLGAPPKTTKKGKKQYENYIGTL